MRSHGSVPKKKSKAGKGRRPPRGVRKHRRMKKAVERRAERSRKVVWQRLWVCVNKWGTWHHEVTCNAANPVGNTRCRKCGALRPAHTEVYERFAA